MLQNAFFYIFAHIINNRYEKYKSSHRWLWQYW